MSKNAKKAIGISLIILVIIVGYFYIKNRFNIEKDNEFKKFLLGETSAINDNNEEYFIRDLFESNDIKYFYCDIDGDSLKELHIKSDKFYYILKCKDSLLSIFYEGSIYEYPIDKNNLFGVLYYRYGGAPTHDTYQFRTFETSGKIKSEKIFEWYDENETGIMDEGDIYLIDNSEMFSMSKWKETTEIYRNSIIEIETEDWEKINIVN